MTDANNQTREVHFILQSKGGVGKSLISATVAQYLLTKGKQIACVDVDPNNATFSQYPSLNVAYVNILENKTIIQERFDLLIEKIARTDADFIIDTGGSTFYPMTKYMQDNEIYDLLAEHNKTVYFHYILTGGQGQEATISSFQSFLDEKTGAAKFVVWENEFWGPILVNGEYPITSLKSFKEQKAQGRIVGSVKYAQRTSDDFLSTALKMNSNFMTLEDVMNSPDFTMVAKSRARKIVSSVFEELEKVDWQ